MVKTIFRTAFVLSFCCQLAIAQEPIETIYEDYAPVTMRYWFDKDYANATELPYANGTTAIDINALTSGFHTLHYQVVDNHGATSPVRFSTFFIPERSIEILYEDYTPQTMRYWFDKDYTAATELRYANGTTAIDINALPAGFHTLHYQVIDNHGATSPVRFSTFFIPERSIETIYEDYTPQTMRYWFDKNYTEATELPYSSGIIAIDVTALAEGVHTLHYQVTDNHGATSPVRFSTFLIPQRVKEELNGDYAVQTIRYWFDNDDATMHTEAWAGGAQALDLSYLSEGVHTMCYQLETIDGKVSPVCTTTIDRWLYDIYVSKTEEYTDSMVSCSPLFATRPDLKLHYLTSDVNVRGHLTVDEGTTLSLGKYVQTANWGTQHNNNMYAKTGEDYYHPTTLLNEGFVRADSVMVKQSFYRDRWHFLSMPFNANVGDIGVPDGTYYALRAYDGEARALGEMTDTWTNLRKGDQMEAGRGYIVQLTRESSDKTAELTFKALNDPQKNNIFTTQDVITPLEEHQAEFAHNRSWNLVGNPYPSFYDSRYMNQDGTIIVWNGNGYSAYSLTDDSYILMPFEAFFIQKPLNVEALTFSKGGRQHTDNVGAGPFPSEARLPVAFVPARQLARRSSATSRHILNFTLTDAGEDACAPIELSRLVINEQAAMGYEQDKDAPKFMEVRPQTAQLWSVESGVQYAINERPMGDGLITFSVYAPADGDYRFALVSTLGSVPYYEAATVLDTETGDVWPLSDGGYIFTAHEGMNAARLVVSLKGMTTAISQVTATDDGEIQVADNTLSLHFLKTKDIKVFGLDGRQLYSNHTSNAEITLRSGIYVLDINGRTTKIMVK